MDSTLSKALASDDEPSGGGFGPGWDALFDGGYLFIPSPPGDGGTVAEAVAVLEQAGRHAIRGPVAENGMLAGWALEESRLPIPMTPMTFAPAPNVELVDNTLTGEVRRVPWASKVERIVILVESPAGLCVASVDPRDAAVVPGANLAREDRDTVTFDRTAAIVGSLPTDITADDVQLRAALTRAALMTGAAARAVEMTIQYTGDRAQFGRSISKFQAVQAHLVKAAQHVRAAQVATRSAALAMTSAPANCFIEVAAAKIVASNAAGVIAAATHQATGAMGMTKDYRLGHLTLRLWSWRDEYGSESWWSRRLGHEVIDAGADKMWPIISGAPETSRLAVPPSTERAVLEQRTGL
ncbi:acyl-CoA dehydrogenase family protein [Brevibacterium sp. FAM 24638]|uniref:acyl-CoA dehydrogenase family protein n=1 Tax=Brevibacterium sp. FAM 24638 TaxID=3415681 RepID=UPI003C7B0E67